MGDLRTTTGLALLALFLSSSITFTERAFAAEGIREIDVAVSGLAYDPFTRKLYGSRGSDLLQIDSETGEVLRAFPIGSPILRMALGAGNGLWLGLSNTVVRFNLETLSAEEPVSIDGEVIDLAPSPSDPYTVAVSTPRVPFRWEAVLIIKNGAALPDVARSTYAAINGSFIFVGATLRMGIGPNGIVTANYSSLPLYYAGRMQSLGNYVYHSTGAFWEAGSLGQPEKTSALEPSGNPSALAINAVENAVYFLSDTGTSWDLNRHEHRTFKHTGHFRFPRYDPNSDMNDRSLAAWSSNRVAFHTASKLYLLETDKLFLPADVSLFQAVTQSPIDFGSETSFKIALTNHGPGAALEVTLTNSVSSGIVSWPTGRNLEHRFHTLQPGESTEFFLEVRPVELGVITSRGSLRVNNDLNAQNNSAEAAAAVVRPQDPVTEMLFTASDLAYDASLHRLFFANGGTFGVYDPDAVQVFWPPPSVLLQPAFNDLEPAPGGGSIFVARQFGALQRIDSATLNVSGIVAIGQTVFDIAVSPAVSDLYAVSDERGTYLTSSTGPVGAIIPQQGNTEFSSDGGQLYFLDSGTCALSIYTVGLGGLTLESATNNVGCSDFSVANGRLYFDSGLIYDPATLQKTPASMSFAPPSFVIPRTAGFIDLLHRTNGVWTLRRIDEQTSAVMMSTPVSLTGAPVQMVEAGTNRVAIRTSAGPFGFYVVEYPNPNLLRPEVAMDSNHQINLSFPSVTGSTYRIESSVSLVNAAWTVVRDNVVGTGLRITEPLPGTGSAAFYRVVRL